MGRGIEPVDRVGEGTGRRSEGWSRNLDGWIEGIMEGFWASWVWLRGLGIEEGWMEGFVLGIYC